LRGDWFGLRQNPLWGDYLNALMEQQLAETALMLCAARAQKRWPGFTPTAGRWLRSPTRPNCHGNVFDS
jgi:hypothetical protein